ncbi:MAG: macro domain-containing protein [bacterium]|nr:macro domain-containing protein [bacterium]
MLSKIINNKEIQIIKGDITEQGDIEVIVNSANAYLRAGGGVSGAIHKKAGSDLEIEAINNAKNLNKYPLKVSECIITNAYNLPNKKVIHVLGPVYNQDKPEEFYLQQAYINCLNLADKNGLKSIAFPSISTGIFGYPVNQASEIAIKAIIKTLPNLKNIVLIRFVLFSDTDFNTYKESLTNILK